MEQGLSLAELWPEGLNLRIYFLALLILLLAGFASGILYRTGAMGILSFLCIGAMYVAGSVMGWDVWQCISVGFTLLAALQVGFFTGAAIAALQSAFRRRFAPHPAARGPSRDRLLTRGNAGSG